MVHYAHFHDAADNAPPVGVPAVPIFGGPQLSASSAGAMQDLQRLSDSLEQVEVEIARLSTLSYVAASKIDSLTNVVSKLEQECYMVPKPKDPSSLPKIKGKGIQKRLNTAMGKLEVMKSRTSDIPPVPPPHSPFRPSRRQHSMSPAGTETSGDGCVVQ